MSLAREWVCKQIPLNVASYQNPLEHFITFPCLHVFSLQSVIVKSVERNALNMYEARKCLLGLESSGVPMATSPSAVSCPVGLSCPGLDILSSAGLGLTGLGKKSTVLYCTPKLHTMSWVVGQAVCFNHVFN